MNHIVWDKSYEMGVDFLDKEHKLLFSRMDKLLKLSETEEKSEWACREGVKYLKNHAVEHFEHEEAYMLSATATSNYIGICMMTSATGFCRRLKRSWRGTAIPWKRCVILWACVSDG